MNGQPITYLICMDRPLGGPVHFAQHYLGTTINLSQRIETHRAGKGARMLAAAVERGISFEVIRTWEGGREVERRLKSHHRAWSFCPVHGR